MDTVKTLGDYYKIPDYFSGIYGGVSVAQSQPKTSSLSVLPHHFKELTEGSGLHLSTLARTGVRSISDPDQIYHILSRHNKIDPADLKAKKSTLTMSRDGKPILAFLNPLMPDEAHSKKDGFTYMAARGSCKPPLIWAPQAKVTSFNRSWLESIYGEEIVAEVDRRLTDFQTAEKEAIIRFLSKKLSDQGFGPKSEPTALKLFAVSGLYQSYNALEDPDVPIEVTEGQKKMYCMAQAKEYQMISQLLELIGKLSPDASEEQTESIIRGVDYIKPALFVCTPGVWLIVSKNPSPDKSVKYILNESWRRMINFAGRDLVMTWDADAAYNVEVANAAQWTGWAMQREFPGCRPHWRLYDENYTVQKQDGCPVKLGADDLIVHFGPDAFFSMPVCQIATGIPRAQMISEANKLFEETGKINFIGYLEQKYKDPNSVTEFNELNLQATK